MTDEIRPFTIDVPESVLDDLRVRLSHTRWPDRENVDDWSQGVPLTYVQDVAAYWADDYDWRRREAALNRFDQYVTEIDGVDIHFVHVKSGVDGARPLLLTHSWPGSIVEFLDVIGPLTNPEDPADAFDLVIPSLPGHGFSGTPAEPGWDVKRVARAWAELMARLGYDAYLTAGGDWGTIVSLELARLDASHVRGAYLAALLTLPSGADGEVDALSEEDQGRLAEAARFDAEMSAYLHLQASRPLTVSYGLTDSPAGQLAWIVEKFHEFNKLVKTPEDEVGRDRLLTNVSVYWLTGTAASSAQLYYESGEYLGALFTPGATPEPVTVPLGVGAYLQDIGPPIRSFAERDYPTIVHWAEFDRGGHFAALEQPALFAGDLRAFARSLG